MFRKGSRKWFPGYFLGRRGGGSGAEKGSPVCFVYTSCAHSVYVFLSAAQFTHNAKGRCHFCRQCPSCDPLLGAACKCIVHKSGWCPQGVGHIGQSTRDTTLGTLCTAILMLYTYARSRVRGSTRGQT